MLCTSSWHHPFRQHLADWRRHCCSYSIPLHPQCPVWACDVCCLPEAFLGCRCWQRTRLYCCSKYLCYLGYSFHRCCWYLTIDHRRSTDGLIEMSRSMGQSRQDNNLRGKAGQNCSHHCLSYSRPLSSACHQGLVLE